jgi:hypothetical protein
LHVWLRSRDFLPAPAARALIGTTNLRFVSGAASPLSLREIRQSRLWAAFACMAPFERFPARASGACVRAGARHASQAPALTPLSPPDTTKPPSRGFCMYGSVRAISCPRQRRRRSSAPRTCGSLALQAPSLRRTWMCKCLCTPYGRRERALSASSAACSRRGLPPPSMESCSPAPLVHPCMSHGCA